MKRLLCLLSLVACGDDGGNTPADAAGDGNAMIDAEIDAPVGPLPVTLTIRADGSAVAGKDVYFQNADGTLAGKVATNASGVASQIVTSGGWVTVVNPFDGNPFTGINFAQVRTFAGVKPGDQLLLEEGNPTPTPVTINLTLPAITNGVVWEVSTTCGGDFLTALVGQIELDGCNGSADFAVVAYDTNDAPIGFFVKTNVTVGAGANVTFVSDSYTALPTASFQYSNIPAQFASVSVNNTLLTTRGPLYNTFAGGDLTAGAVTVTAPRPNAPASTSMVMSMFEEANPSLTESIALTWAPIAAPATFDGSTRFLPAFATAPTFDAANRRISWTSTSGSATPEFVLAGLSAIRETPLMGWDWEIVAPYSDTQVTYPQLPTEIAQYNHLAADVVDVEQLVNAKAPGGYDAVRGKLFSTNGPEGIVSGANGEILAVSFNTDDNPGPLVRPMSSTWTKAFDRMAKVAKKQPLKASGKRAATQRTKR